MASEDDDIARFDNICDIRETREKAREIYRLVKSSPNVSSLGTVALAAICAYVASSRLGNGDVRRNLALTVSSLATMADFETGVSTVEYALSAGNQRRKSRSSTHGFYDRLIEEHRLTAVSDLVKRSMRKAEDFLVMQAVFDIDNREIKYAIFYWIHAILMPNVRLDHEAFLEETGNTGQFDRIVELLTSSAAHLKGQITAERREHVLALPGRYPTPSKTPTHAQRATKSEKILTPFDSNNTMTLTRPLTLKIPLLGSDSSSTSSPCRSPITRPSEAPPDGGTLSSSENHQEDAVFEQSREKTKSRESVDAQEDLLPTIKTLREKLAESHKLLDAQQSIADEKLEELGRNLDEKEAALSAANAAAASLQVELSSLKKDLKNKESELAVATMTITTLQTEMQPHSRESQQKHIMLRDKLEHAQHQKETRQERLENQVSKTAAQPSGETSGVKITSDQQIETDITSQHSQDHPIALGRVQEEAGPRSRQRYESVGEDLEDLESWRMNSHEDTLRDEIQRLREDNDIITTRYKRKIDALKRQIASERKARQQQDILEYLSISAQSAHLSEAIEDYEPRSETSRRILVAVRSHLKALDTIGERRRKIPLKYDKLVEVMTNRYGIKEEELDEVDEFILWGPNEDEELDESAGVEPRHKKRKVASIS
ncbi:uncharacterized protein BT62DRAFT_994662 [Guyanagaster necrorhizus]|uniref:Uncharacterized protein n=1 Tax=Guyanagaster necrorhizus TaxID=856835 RepID=A0A9P8ATB0_9AGAR|nr:uncharacterized protein BT62DRAFT_994662 [Guyanagaster necrorhizus MCA 3950]KAG7445702.1 hypothetical protein BT62DRAFT_994662 [Guyanagaster necrorhizus MCA 3950]